MSDEHVGGYRGGQPADQVNPPVSHAVTGMRISKNTDDKTQVRYLYQGDQVEYGVTHLVQYDRGEQMWLKAGATTKVQPDETDQDAMARLTGFVHDRLDAVVPEAVERARSLGSS